MLVRCRTRPAACGTLLACWRERFAGDLETGLDALFGEPSLVHLQHVTHRFGGAVRGGGLRLHVGQIGDGAVLGDEGRSQGNVGVLHPETLALLAREDEQHALGLWHGLAKHEPDFLLLRGYCQLRVNLVDPYGQRGALEVHLRRALGPERMREQGAGSGQSE